MKKLLNVGCSFSAKLRLADKRAPDLRVTPPYSQVFAERLKMECVNMSETGIGNEKIFSNIIDFIQGNQNVDLILVQWSEWDRETLYTNDGFQFKTSPRRVVANPSEKHKKLFSEHPHILKINELKANHFYNFKYMISKQMMRMYLLQELCKLKKIDLIMFQGLSLFNSHLSKISSEFSYIYSKEDRNNVANFLLNNIYFDAIEEKSFWGWPMIRELGGMSYDFWLEQKGNDKVTKINKFHLWPTHDTHPNSEGHTAFAEELIKYYEKMYL